jgi:hypothetical protein
MMRRMMRPNEMWQMDDLDTERLLSHFYLSTKCAWPVEHVQAQAVTQKKQHWQKLWNEVAQVRLSNL